MRRLIAIIIILTGILSGVVGLSSAAGQIDQNHPGCLTLPLQGNMVVLDAKSGYSLLLPNNNRAYSLGIGDAEKRYRLFTRPMVSGVTKLFLEDTQGTYHFLHDISAIQIEFLSPDEKQLGVVWGLPSEAGQYNRQVYMNIISLQNFQIHTFPTTFDNAYAAEWSSDSKYFFFYENLPTKIFDTLTGSVTEWDFFARSWSTSSNRLVAISRNTFQNSNREVKLIIMNGNGSDARVFTMEGRQGEAFFLLGFSPDDRFILLYKDTPSSKSVSRFLFLDTVSGQIWTTENNYPELVFYPLPNQNSFLVKRVANGRTQPFILNPEMQTETPFFTDSTAEMIEINKEMVLFSTTNADNTKNLHRMNLDGSNPRLIAENFIMPAGYTSWQAEPYFIVAAKRDGNYFLIIDDLKNINAVYVREISDSWLNIQKFNTITAEKTWVAVNYGKDGDSYAMILNIKTHEIREFGRGQFAPPGIFKFDLPDGLVFWHPRPDGTNDYQIFDQDANSVAQFTLSKELAEKWKIPSPNYSKLLVREVNDEQIIQLRMVEQSDAASTLVMEQLLTPGAWRDLVGWTNNGKYIVIARQNQDFSQLQDSRGTIRVYDLEGNLIHSSAISNNLLSVSFSSYSCTLSGTVRKYR